MSSRPESEWDEDQQAWMLALAEYRASLCPCGCGNDRADTLGPEGAAQWKTSRIRCHARTALAEAQNAAAEDGKTYRPEGLMWIVTKAKA